jgi:copper chaperone
MEQRFHVSGMSCGHCVRSVTEAVQGVDPAANVAVDLQSKMVTVNGTADRSRVAAAIIDAGYEVEAAAT